MVAPPGTVGVPFGGRGILRLRSPVAKPPKPLDPRFAKSSIADHELSARPLLNAPAAMPREISFFPSLEMPFSSSLPVIACKKSPSACVMPPQRMVTPDTMNPSVINGTFTPTTTTSAIMFSASRKNDSAPVTNHANRLAVLPIWVPFSIRYLLNARSAFTALRGSFSSDMALPKSVSAGINCSPSSILASLIFCFIRPNCSIGVFNCSFAMRSVAPPALFIRRSYSRMRSSIPMNDLMTAIVRTWNPSCSSAIT